MAKRFASIVLAVLLLVSAALPAFAKETEPAEAPEIIRILYLATPEDLLKLAQNCRLDAYSENLKVILEQDIDMTGIAFSSIPYFNGTLEGQGHTISGLELTVDGSYQGMFRYLGKEAVVNQLHLKANITPNGSRGYVGGIAGENAGRISGCSFTGTVEGGAIVGGIAGSNTLTGIIEDCETSGSIGGSYSVGGIAGDNTGVIRRCENSADINTTAQQNQVALSDLSLETLTRTESPASVTDVGGIAGSSGGVITECTNQGIVGYQQMGYNVGGIAGRQTGTVLRCKNYGSVFGRKEVGGIVGHLEPAAEILYDEDALQILERQLDGLQNTVGMASANVSNTADDLTGYLTEMSWFIEDAWEAASMLAPGNGTEPPDMDTIIAAQNGLSASLANMTYTMRELGTTTYSSMGALSSNMISIQNQVGAMGVTLGNAAETLGGRVEDVSDQDTEEDMTGKVAECVNYAPVHGDINLGGIVGAIAMQSELDASDAIRITGEDSLNFVSKVRAVVRSCRNLGEITGGKQHLGGIAGYQTLGLIRESDNTATIGQADARYVGGIVGNSTGYVRHNSAKCYLEGAAYIGGIAGSGTVATDCRTMVGIIGGKEKLGAVLGSAGENLQQIEDPIRNNLYTYHGQDPGGIDGISYSGKAEGMVQTSFLVLEDTPELFRKVTVTFRFADGSEKVFSLKPGTGLKEAEIPAVPEMPGFEGSWDGLAETDITHIDFDLFFDLVYESDNPTIAAQESRNGLPVLLVQGNFAQEAGVVIAAAQELPAMGEGWIGIEGWDIAITGVKAVTSGRYLMPEAEGRNPTLLVRLSDGSWQGRSFDTNGSYLVFQMDGTETGIAFFVQEKPAWYNYALGAACGVLAVVVIHLLKKKMK